jgi:hypothetical protein
MNESTIARLFVGATASAACETTTMAVIVVELYEKGERWVEERVEHTDIAPFVNHLSRLTAKFRKYLW